MISSEFPRAVPLAYVDPLIFTLRRNGLQTQLQAGCTTPFFNIDTDSNDFEAFDAYMQPITKALAMLRPNGVELVEMAATLDVAEPGQRFGCSEASTWHNDKPAWYEGDDSVLLTSDQGTEYLSGRLHGPILRPISIIRDQLDETLITNNPIVIEQATPNLGVLIAADTIHRAPINQRPYPAERQIIVARYRPATER